MAATSRLNVVINVSQTGQSALGSVTRGVTNLGKAAATAAVAGVAVLGVATAALGTKLVGLGSDAQEMQGKFDVVFGQFAGQVTDQLSTFAEEVGRSRFELMGFSSTIQDTLVPLGFARGAAADMSVEVVKLATDLGSFNNLPTQQVIEDIQSALVGNTETLRKYGVVANQAAIEQMALDLGIWDGVNAMDAQTKAAAIMQIILDGTTDAQGDAARTSESWANQMRGLKATITDTGTEIGLKLLPVLSPLLSIFGQIVEAVGVWLMDAFTSFQPVLDKFQAAFEALAAGDYTTFMENIGLAIDGLMEKMGLSEETRENFSEFWSELITIWQGEGGAFDKIGESIMLILDYMGANQEALDAFGEVWETLGDVIEGQTTPWQVVSDILDNLLGEGTVDAVVDLYDALVDLGGDGTSTTNGGALGTFLWQILKWMTGGIVTEDMFLRVGMAIRFVADGVRGMLEAWQDFKQWWDTNMSGFGGGVPYNSGWTGGQSPPSNDGWNPSWNPPGGSGGSGGSSNNGGGSGGDFSEGDGPFNNMPHRGYTLIVNQANLGSLKGEFEAMAALAGGV